MDHLDALFPPAPAALARLRAAALAAQQALASVAALEDDRCGPLTTLAARLEWTMRTHRAKTIDTSVRALWSDDHGGAHSAHQRLQRAAAFAKVDEAMARVAKEGATLLRAVAQGTIWQRTRFLPKLVLEITAKGAHATFGRCSSMPLDLHLPAVDIAARALLVALPPEMDGEHLYTVSWRTSVVCPGPGDVTATLPAFHPTQALALFGTLYEHRVFQPGGVSHTGVHQHRNKAAWDGLYGPPGTGWSPDTPPARGPLFF